MGDSRGNRSSGLGRYRRTMQTAIRNNSAPFGFSIVATGSFGILAEVRGSVGAAEVLLFGLGAVASFTLLDLIATGGFHRRLASEPPELVAHASSLSFLSVGCGLAIAIGIAHAIHGLVAWPLASLLASSAYIAGAGAELAVAERAAERRDERPGADRGG